jgi:DNA-binding MarR family transcriptional regulator
MSQFASQSHYAALAEFHGQLHRCLTTTEAKASELGLQLEEYQMLLAVKAYSDGEAATPGALAARLQTDRGTIGKLLDNLVRRGFLHRQRDQNDRRRVLITLTPAGERWLASLSSGVMDDLAKSGLTLFRALRVVLTHTINLPTPPVAAAAVKNDLEMQAWRPMAPASL